MCANVIKEVNHVNTRLTEQEFGERIEACKEKMYRFAYCYVKNEQEALDIVSEATYKAFLAYKRMKSPEYFESWMGRIVINCALDHIRRKKKVTYLEDNQVEVAAKESAVSLEEKMDLYDALDQLDPEDRAIIILKIFEDQRFKDMADVLSMPENTVKTKFYRIIEKLKKSLIRKEVDAL